MKKQILLITLLAAVVIAPLQAQSTRKDRDPAAMEARALERADERTEHLVRELGLDEEQARKLGMLNSDFAKGMSDLRTSGLADEERKERAKALRQQRETDMKNMLTEAQYARLLEIRKARRAAHQERKGQHPGKGGHRGGALEKPRTE